MDPASSGAVPCSDLRVTGLSEAVLGARANLVSSLVLLGVAIFLELIVLSVIRVRTGHGKKVVR